MRLPEDELAQLEQQGLLRVLREVLEADGSECVIAGKKYVQFCSNDYLGLSIHPLVKQAFVDGVEKWGSGSGGSRLISGSLTPHLVLEKQIAQLKGTEACRVFANGYTTSLGVLGGLLGSGDVVILDKLSHASLIDGAKLSGATLRVFQHNNVAKLEELLIKYQGVAGRVLVVTESVFSMDGDIAPLVKITQLTRRYGALLMVDEAHAIGVHGALGLGHLLGVSDGIDFHMGTLGKAAGVAGGYVACSQAYADLLVNRARSYIYSTSPPPGQMVAAASAMALIAGDVGQHLRERLWENIRYFEACIGLKQAAQSAIIPWLVGDSVEAMLLSENLKKRGYLVPAVRFPTVPRDTARLRITLSALHTREQLEGLAEAIKELSQVRS